MVGGTGRSQRRKPGGPGLPGCGMDLVKCPEHGKASVSGFPSRGLWDWLGVADADLLVSSGDACFLKTGVRDGPNKGKSFYVCRTNTCGFVQATE